MKKHHAILFMILFSIIGNIIYLDHKLDYSPVPTQWEVGSGWGRYYIITHGKIPKNEMVLTPEENVKNYACVDVMPKIFASIISIVTGMINFPMSEEIYYIFPWVGTIFLPLVVLYFYSYISKFEKKEIDLTDAMILFLFAIFPLASSLVSMSKGVGAANAVARVFFILLTVIFIKIFSTGKSDIKILGMFIFLLFPFFNYHHTWSYYFLIIFSTTGILTFIKRKQSEIIKIVILILLIFLVIAFLYNPQLEKEPKRLIKHFFTDVKIFNAMSISGHIIGLEDNLKYINNVFYFTGGSRHLDNFIGYNPFSSVYGYLQFISSMLLLLIFLVFLWMYFKTKCPKPYEELLFYILVAEGPIIIGLYIWNGFFGIYARIFESITYLSLLFSGYILRKSSSKLKNIIRIIVLSIVALCLVSAYVLPKTINDSLTAEEYIGIKFAGNKIPKTAYVFSDFRLGTPLIYFNLSKIRTIDTLFTEDKLTEELLVRCYYMVSKPELALDKFIGCREYYVLLSERQTDVFIFDTTHKDFKPASKDFLIKWSTQLSFELLYSSNYIQIFKRGDPMWKNKCV